MDSENAGQYCCGGVKVVEAWCGVFSCGVVVGRQGVVGMWFKWLVTRAWWFMWCGSGGW